MILLANLIENIFNMLLSVPFFISLSFNFLMFLMFLMKILGLNDLLIFGKLIYKFWTLLNQRDRF